MLTIAATNVNTAFQQLCQFFNDPHNRENGKLIQSESRNGKVLRVRGPVCIEYYYPHQRVLFNRARDCNPFFHVYESLWMLAGRNDLASLTTYVKDFGKYSDDGETLHGAYGYRWRKYFGYDQLDWIIEELTADPSTRRCVLQMWDGGRTERMTRWDSESQTELFTDNWEAVGGTGDLYVATHGGKDVPCNLCAVFEVVEDKLNMTVYNRSNDTILGMLGANAVHFSFLQEYVAQSAGYDLGSYFQISSNCHVYIEQHNVADYLDGVGDPVNYPVKSDLVPLVEYQSRFDREVTALLENNDTYVEERFLSSVAQPMMLAHRHHKERDYVRAIEAAERIASADWRRASIAWLSKRESLYLAKKS